MNKGLADEPEILPSNCRLPMYSMRIRIPIRRIDSKDNSGTEE